MQQLVLITKKQHLQQVNLINVEKVSVDEDEVTSVTAQLCNLCLNVPANYVFRNTYDETLTITLRSYKEFEFLTSLEDDDDDDNDAEDKSSVLGSKRKQPAERANIKQYDDLKPRRKFDIINTLLHPNVKHGMIKYVWTCILTLLLWEFLKI